MNSAQIYQDRNAHVILYTHDRAYIESSMGIRSDKRALCYNIDCQIN